MELISIEGARDTAGCGGGGVVGREAAWECELAVDAGEREEARSPRTDSISFSKDGS